MWASSALCPSREREGFPAACWGQQWVPITQPVVQPQNPQGQGWWKAVLLLCRDGARSQGQPGHQECPSLPLRGRKALKCSRGEIAAKGNWEAAKSKSCCFTWSWKGKKVSWGFWRIRSPGFLPALRETPTYTLMSRCMDSLSLRTLQLEKLAWKVPYPL